MSPEHTHHSTVTPNTSWLAPLSVSWAAVHPNLSRNTTRTTSNSFPGNLGSAILKSLVNVPEQDNNSKIFNLFIACVQSESSAHKLRERFHPHVEAGTIIISRGNNVKAIQESEVTILGVDPSAVETTLGEPGTREALAGKLLISVVAGLTREKLENNLASSGTERVWVLRTLPNIAALASESLTAIEDPHPDMPSRYFDIANATFKRIGDTVHIPARLMNATTAVGGSTPAFFAVICDALIDAAVAVGVPRPSAQAMIYQSMKGTAAMLQSGMHPGILKDQGTSPEGCTIGGLMVLEEAGVRGHVGKALREAVTIARLMESGKENQHVNDTR